MASLHTPITNVTKNLTLTLTLTGVRSWQARVWVGTQLIRLAARVMGVGFRVETDT